MFIEKTEKFLDTENVSNLISHFNCCLCFLLPSPISLAQIKIGLNIVFDHIGLGGCLWFLIGDLEEGVIFNIIDYVWGQYPESLMKIWHDLAAWHNLGLGVRWGFLTGDLEDEIKFEIIHHAGWWLGRYPESLMKIRPDLANWLHMGLVWHLGFMTGDLEVRGFFLF